MTELKDRFSGTLLGMAMGDALGAPLEGMSRDEIERRVGKITGMVDPADFGSDAMSWRMPGLYTDDTQLALLIASTLIETGTFSADFFCRICVRLSYVEGQCGPNVFGVLRGTGPNFRKTVELWKKGTPWNLSGLDTAGNGAAMRVAPIGMFYRDDPEKLIRMAAESAILTHRNPTGVLAAISMAQLVSWMSSQQPQKLNAAKGAEYLMQQAKTALNILEVEYTPYLLEKPTTDDPWFAGLQMLPEMINQETEVYLTRILDHAKVTSRFRINSPAAAYAPASVLTAMTIALTRGHDAYDALTFAVALGHDSDTVGAMVGAAVGALHGELSLPAKLLSETANVDDIKAIGKALYRESQQVPTDEPVPDVMLSERKLCEQQFEQWKHKFK